MPNPLVHLISTRLGARGILASFLLPMLLQWSLARTLNMCRLCTVLVSSRLLSMKKPIRQDRLPDLAHRLRNSIPVWRSTNACLAVSENFLDDLHVNSI